MLSTVIITIFIFFSDFSFTTGEMFTSISTVENFLETEIRTIHILKDIVEQEYARLEKLKRSISSYEDIIYEGLLEGVVDPVQVYILIKNIFTVWTELSHLAQNRTGFNNITSWRTENNVEPPEEEDLDETLRAFANLQYVYNIKQETIMGGKMLASENADVVVNNNVTNALLNSYECYKIGQYCNEYNEFDKAYSWLDLSFKTLNHKQDHSIVLESQKEKFKKTDLLDSLSETMFNNGNVKKALQLMDEVRDIAPNEKKFKDSFIFMNETKCKIEDGKRFRSHEHMDRATTDKYIALCNNKIQNVDTNLYCFYQKTNPYLLLAPLKAEYLVLDPVVLLFRNVISDSEIEIVKKLSMLKLKRAQTSGSKKPKIRIAKVGWLNDPIDTVKALDKRLEHMTNLNMSYAEPLQKPSLDRVATVMFYLSTPEAGGATIFPHLNLTIFPSKNDAVVWYNIHKNGKMDNRMFHAGCPVIVGSKWVANKWIRERGQEFSRQCSLNENE